MTPSPPTLTIEETHRLLDTMLGCGGTEKQFSKRLRNYTMAMIMLEAGLRVGELVKLRWSTLFFNCLPVTSIIISRETSKSPRDRQIPVSTRLSDALSTYHAHFIAPRSTAQPVYAFIAPGALRPLTTRQVERIINSAAIEALGRPVHPHVLRHTFATKLMRIAPPSVVQELLGHKHLSSTQVYCHPNSDDLKKAISTMEDSDPEANARAPRIEGALY